jgi:serine/threonine-protein kinase
LTFIKKGKFDHFIGKDVGRCIIVKEIGRGSMGVVYVAYQKTLKRPVAIKILPKETIRNPIVKKRFQSEAELAAILNHPNIIQIYDVGETEEFLYVIMQLVNGESLYQLLQRTRKHVLPSKRILPFHETFRIMLQILSAIGYAHDMDITHRDLKPANILIEEKTKRVYVSDFGIAKDIRGEDLDGGMILGTPLYISPEQAGGKETDKRTDIYSLGCILFEMTAGTLPIREDNLEEFLKRKVEDSRGVFTMSPSEVNPNIDDQLEGIILRAISYNKEDRFPDCGAFAREIEAYMKKVHLIPS